VQNERKQVTNALTQASVTGAFLICEPPPVGTGNESCGATYVACRRCAVCTEIPAIAQFDGYAGRWSLISVVTPLPPTVLPLDGPANVPSGGDQTVNLA